MWVHGEGLPPRARRPAAPARAAGASSAAVRRSAPSRSRRSGAMEGAKKGDRKGAGGLCAGRENPVTSGCLLPRTPAAHSPFGDFAASSQTADATRTRDGNVEFGVASAECSGPWGAT